MDSNTALIIMDMQKGFDDQAHWGGNRNNPDAEKVAQKILHHWRSKKLPVFHVMHDSLLDDSPLKISKPGGELKPEIDISEGEEVIYKRVNSAFIGTTLDILLRKKKISSIVILGLTTNHCVSTTARMGGNLGYTVFVVEDATATFDRVDHKGEKFSAELVHKISLANLHNEFCTVLSSQELLSNF